MQSGRALNLGVGLCNKLYSHTLYLTHLYIHMHIDKYYILKSPLLIQCKILKLVDDGSSALAMFQVASHFNYTSFPPLKTLSPFVQSMLSVQFVLDLLDLDQIYLNFSLFPFNFCKLSFKLPSSLTYWINGNRGDCKVPRPVQPNLLGW